MANYCRYFNKKARSRLIIPAGNNAHRDIELFEISKNCFLNACSNVLACCYFSTFLPFVLVNIFKPSPLRPNLGQVRLLGVIKRP